MQLLFFEFIYLRQYIHNGKLLIVWTHIDFDRSIQKKFMDEEAEITNEEKESQQPSNVNAHIDLVCGAMRTLRSVPHFRKNYVIYLRHMHAVLLETTKKIYHYPAEITTQLLLTQALQWQDACVRKFTALCVAHPFYNLICQHLLHDFDDVFFV